jgi:hypothetical protein
MHPHGSSIARAAGAVGVRIELDAERDEFDERGARGSFLSRSPTIPPDVIA